MQIPPRGKTHHEILQRLNEYRRDDLDLHAGKVFAYCYNPEPEIEQTSQAAYLKMISENALDPTSFPSLLQLERDVVRMIAGLLRGSDEVVGNFTSGGTESILLAVKTARDFARATRPDVVAPEILLAKSAHGAFHKAAQYFGLTPVVVGIDRNTFQLDPAEMARAITKNTVMMVASAPQYAHGVIDPVRAVAAIAAERNIWLHVDACVGGIHLSFMRQMPGFSVPDFDFSIPGVNSMSADMHKYGYAPKGASVVLYRNKSLRRHQIYSTINPATYALVNPTIQSSKSGGPIAGAWAVLQRLGDEGYQSIITGVMNATRQIIDRVNATGVVRVLGKPDMCMFAIASDTINVFELADEMRLRGWYLQPQFSTEYSPMNLHVSVSHKNVAGVDAFCQAFDESLAVLKSTPPMRIDDIRGQVEEMLANVSSPEEAMAAFSEVAGFKDGQLPERMAFINGVLECLPRDLGAQILGDFINDMYV